ncbi:MULTISPECIES: ABC transporter substrate-binding protein [unclassified Fusibacter]|uniref:ABC transporter substrate-binding protein n=1 Tax=unclassified Fusibacter TaxID=2624464 RepID=UPI001013853C|nr:MULTISPECIES: PhnD/SsuA/transferrin family substrate-binding protein [unclassified Fusibacter]MCK8061604.1 PhnD/SsuA/transferrin family substrate-binding protein [Fusibacter sp. A2]NPE23787.1 ABC transporter substrate-binding protein [Fusibacter sp. A1]RXV58692.1 ABC transporter substrate-binding protein [Fusibacter sp. A1]
MKKNLFILMTTIVLILSLVGCQTTQKVIEKEPEPVQKQELHIGTLKGPTGMGMAYLMDQNETGASAIQYTFDIVGAPDQLIGKIVQGEVQIAAVPTNLAAILNTKTEGKIQLLAVNTLGVLYVVENGDTIQTIDDLKGAEMMSSGKGASPEFVFNYILNENGMTAGDDVIVDYALEHGELAATVAAGDTKIALLPEPFVTTVLSKNPDLRIALDLTDEWSKTTGGAVLPMGAIVVNKAFAADNPEVIAQFMIEYSESVDFVNSNQTEAGNLISKFDIIPDPLLATKAIDGSSITLITAEDAKDDIIKFFEILKGFNPQSIGGQVPDESFFYKQNQ